MENNSPAKAPEPIVLDLATECDDPSVTQTDTLCMRCMEQGSTRLLLTQLPHFKEVMVSSFTCPHCGHSDSSLINAGSVQDRGVKITLKVTKTEDLRRMIVKSDTACVKIPEVELEIPKAKGEITTVEGLLTRTCEGLELDQEQRRLHHPELAQQIQDFVARLRALPSLEQPFRVEINDPSGNSDVECPPGVPVDVTREHYERTQALNEMLGLATSLGNSTLADLAEEDEEEEQTVEEKEDMRQEVNSLEGLCERCGESVITRIKLTDIPHFKEVLVMGTACDSCGHKTREVKPGGGVSPKGRTITLHLKDHPYDLHRDVLKSDTCSVEVPEWELFVGGGIIGGKFTTVEGLLADIKEDMGGNQFLTGDSVMAERKEKVHSILRQIDEVMSGTASITMKLDDPAGNSYLQNLYAPDPDPCLTIEDYERTEAQDEDLGLTGMKTEGYEEDEKSGV